MRKIDIARPCVGDAELKALEEPIRTGWLTQGPKVAEFEARFADFHQVKHAIAVSNCTCGLHLILAAMGIGPGDEVIVPAFTWISTANAVCYCGATPVLADIRRDTFNIDPALLPDIATDRTRAVIPVHLFGLCADIDAVKSALPGIPVVEDAACAVGARYKNRYAGTLGKAAAFSFHPRKIITTGEGGMVTTNDNALADRLKALRTHGASISEEERHNGPKPYLLPNFTMLGFNYRMTDLQGAVGLAQLTKLENMLAERRQWADWYNDRLAGIPWLKTPFVPENVEHSRQAYVCMVDESKAPMSRNQIMEYLQDRGISTRPGTHALHMLDHYRDRFGFKPEDFPNALQCDRCTLTLPLHNNMSGDDYEYVVKTLVECDGMHHG